MRTLAGLLLASSIALCFQAVPAASQTGFSSNKDCSTACAASEFLQPVDGATDTGLTNSLAESIDPFKAEGGPLKLMNCSGGSIKARTFNSNDSALLIAFQEKSIANGAIAGLKCATSSCKVAIGSGKASGALSGYQVLLGNSIKATNSKATESGCIVFDLAR